MSLRMSTFGPQTETGEEGEKSVNQAFLSLLKLEREKDALSDGRKILNF